MNIECGIISPLWGILLNYFHTAIHFAAIAILLRASSSYDNNLRKIGNFL
jgi:hypothetical protein